MNKQQENAVVIVKDVTKSFSRPVLKNISLTVYRAQSVLLCGINGAGKSTLLRIISGLLGPDSGHIEIAGKCIRKEAEQTKSKMGIIMHQSMVYPDLTVLENMNFFANLYAIPGKRQRIEELLESVALTAYRHDRASILSRGLLQRLSIARAMLHKPEVLLADEPFTGLDTASLEHVIKMFNSFQLNGGAIMLTSHDAALGFRCADRAIVIDQMKIIFDRPVSEINHAMFAQDYLEYSREFA